MKHTLKNLKDKDFSLVLSGGAALGFAHLGVIKYLEENNLKPKEVIGTSFGALIGGLYALGYTYDELFELMTHLHLIKLISIKYQKTGFKCEKLYQYLKKLYKNKKIEDTIIPFKAVATNYLTGESYAFSQEDDIKLIDAIFASISIPGIFPPKKIHNQYYVDGFLISNLPVEYANPKNLILAIDVNNVKNIVDFRNKKKKLFRRLKYVFGTISNTINWMIVNQTREKIKILEEKKIKYILIEPNLSEFKKSDFKKALKIYQKGYEEILKFNSH